MNVSLRKSDLMPLLVEQRQRAESAEQQVAALVQLAEKVIAIDEHISLHELFRDEWEDIAATARLCFLALPDRAKKIQAVVEAAKHHEQIWRQKSDQGDQIKCGCGICQAVRDLESKEIP